MAPPIAGNGRAIPGRLPLPPAVVPAAVPAPPVAGSLPHPIKWNPHPPFYRFNLIPSLPVVVSPLPAVLLFLPFRRPPPPRRPTLCFPRRPPEVPPRRQPWCARHDSASGRRCRVPCAPADVATT